MSSIYTSEFFINLEDGAERSAQEIVPLILDLIQPRSVIDVGCGTGSWLSIFKQAGISDCLGVDGDYVSPELLKIASEEFLTHDLKLPLQINKKFDLVISLEVAEHLPKDCAEIFINSLTNLGNIILFSAAIPYQGGTEHLNEQWPEYWVDIFKDCGYIVVDCLRHKIWENEKVEAWYAQNMLLFVREDALENYPKLKQEIQCGTALPLAKIHPRMYLNKVQSDKQLSLNRPVQLTNSGVKLKVGENRFGCFEVEIIEVRLLPQNVINSNDFLSVEIEYQSKNPVYCPILSVILSQEDGTECFETNTESLNLSLVSLERTGKIELPLGNLDLPIGRYFVNVGIFARHWAYTYDYHWQVYTLLVQNKI